MGKLTALKVKTARAGKHGDGDGLLLAVTKAGRKQWVYRYQIDKRSREMGLGTYPGVSLAQARAAAQEARRLSKQGIDPIAERNLAQAEIPTFGDAVAAYLQAHSAAWVPRHASIWESSVRRFANPLMERLVDEITTEDALLVLRPIWLDKPRTANDVRGRCEAVLDAQKALKHRQGENPFAWRGNLKHLLAKPGDIAPGGHHAAVPYEDVPAVLAELPDTIAARALKFLVLTATRASEVRFATWAEIDGDLWTIPPERTKQGREHRVPLSGPALAILESQPVVGSHVFPGELYGKPLSHVSMWRSLKRVRPDATAHGFRSSFRDWCEEETSFPRIVAEMALGHLVGGGTERAYRRGDLLEKRRKLMQAWSTHCVPVAVANVVPIRNRC